MKKKCHFKKYCFHLYTWIYFSNINIFWHLSNKSGTLKIINENIWKKYIQCVNIVIFLNCNYFRCFLIMFFCISYSAFQHKCHFIMIYLKEIKQRQQITLKKHLITRTIIKIISFSSNVVIAIFIHVFFFFQSTFI